MPTRALIERGDDVYLSSAPLRRISVFTGETVHGHARHGMRSKLGMLGMLGILYSVSV